MKPLAPLIDELRSRPQRATLGLLGPRSPELLAFLRDRLGGGDGDGFLAEPVLEALHNWEPHPTPFGQLDYLSDSLKNALDAAAAGEHRFPPSRLPHLHQHKAWRHLCGGHDEPKSVLVSTGTASGKTECFLVPILDDLAREHSQAGRPLEGVRALFLYPLNALINSQKERLSAWTRHLGGGVRFALYNGNTAAATAGQPAGDPERGAGPQDAAGLAATGAGDERDDAGVHAHAA